MGAFPHSYRSIKYWRVLIQDRQAKNGQDRQAVGNLEKTKKEERLLLCSKKTKKKVKVANIANFLRCIWKQAFLATLHGISINLND